MARHEFGAGIEDWVVVPLDGIWAVGAGAKITFWNAAVDGSQYTDLLDERGIPVDSVTSRDDGSIPRFYGPDGVVGLWADAGAGTRAWMGSHSPNAGGGGSGTVTSVAGVAPGADGDVPLTPGAVGALPVMAPQAENSSAVNGVAGAYRFVALRTGGTDRWQLQADGTAETGTDSGSNFRLSARRDNGAEAGVAFYIIRATQQAAIGTTSVHGGATLTSAGPVGMRDVTTDPTTATGGAYFYSKGGRTYAKWADGTVLPVGTTVATYTMTGATTIPLPSGTPMPGQIHRVQALASGAARTATFASTYMLSAAVTNRAISVPSAQVLLAEAEYSDMAGGWVLTRAVTTSESTGGGAAPTVNAGADATQTSPTATFARTATETGTVTSRQWSIVSGPMGEGTSIGTAAALSWVPGSSPSGTTDIRQPVFMEMAFEITSTAENGTKDWTTAYRYIEDIHDRRGYTAGLVGFTSATGDMLDLVQRYVQAKPTGNLLASYVSGLQQCKTVGFGSGATAAADQYLGTAYMTAWRTAADTDPLFRRLQRDYRKQIYWDDALVQALADGVGPLGLALYYDILINHGVGNDSESFGGILAAGRASSVKPPTQGGTESAWLVKLCDLRDAVLVGWGDYQSDGRSTIFRKLITDNKLTLVAPFNWSVYGDSYTMSSRPEPPADARIGTYVLRYTATGPGGSASGNLTLTVGNEDDGGTPPPPGSAFANLIDNFNSSTVNATLWPESYGGVSQIGGRARVPATTSYAGFESAAAWQLQNSHVRVEVPTVPPVGGTEDSYCALTVASGTSGTNLCLKYDCITGRLRLESNVSYWDDNAPELTYNGSTHRWWGIREASGTLYFETSTDGVTWTTRRSITTPAWVIGRTTLAVLLEAVRDSGTASYAEFDNFNTTG
ncbi:chitosanase [Streptomyces sp. NPDC004069]